MQPKFCLICLLVLVLSVARGQTKTKSMETTVTPITCKLTTSEFQKRKATVIAELKALVLNRKELSNGFVYEFQSSDEILDKLNTFIETERLCCNFFTFQLTVEENITTLNITGPEGAKEFLKGEVDF
jgi:hypothetical protein